MLHLHLRAVSALRVTTYAELSALGVTDPIMVSVARITIAREAKRARTLIQRAGTANTIPACEHKGVQDPPRCDIVGSGGCVGPRHGCTRNFFSRRHCPAKRTAPSWEAKCYRWAPSPVSSEDSDTC